MKKMRAGMMTMRSASTGTADMRAMHDPFLSTTAIATD